MFKSFLKLAVIMMVTMAVTYFLAGIVAQNILGARAYYPPSPTALGYLRDPSAPGMQLKIWPAQLLRGLLFAVAFFPFRQRLLQLGTWKGGAALSSVIFIVGYLAASGGMIEHFLWFNDYPAKFAAITFVEVLLQTAIMGPWTVAWMKRWRVGEESAAAAAVPAIQKT